MFSFFLDGAAVVECWVGVQQRIGPLLYDLGAFWCGQVRVELRPLGALQLRL